MGFSSLRANGYNTWLSSTTSRMPGNLTGRDASDWYTWGGWSYCSVTCGDGVRWRRRACLTNPRNCQSSTRPDSPYYERTQIEDCILQACVNGTTGDPGVLSTQQIGMSVAISAAIIATVFLVAKSMYCISKKTKSCCKPKSNLAQLSASRESLAERSSRIAHLPVHPRGIENLAGPVYITITQEMITGGVHGQPTNQEAGGVVSRTVSDLSVNTENQSDTNQANNSPAETREHVTDDGSLNASTSVVVNERDVNENTNNTEPQHQNNESALPEMELVEMSQSDSAEMASISALATHKPPPYESLFPLFKRNQTL